MDPDWLIPIVVQSTSALVAIVGAFLVSTLLFIARENSQRRSRIRDLRRDKRYLEERIARTREDHQQALLDEFLEECADDLIEMEARAEIPAEYFIRKYEDYGLPDELLREGLQEAIRQIEEAFVFFEEEHPFGDERPPWNMQEYLMFEGAQLPEDASDMWYERVYDHLRSDWRPPGPNWQDIRPLTPVETVQPYATEPRAVRLSRRLSELQGELNRVETELEDLERRGQSPVEKKPVWSGLGVLTVFGVLGIALPLLLERYAAHFRPEWRVSVVLWAFLGGFILLILYLGWLAHYLRNATAPA